ncbi:MAG TPA: CotH kinase family protein [Polyangiaceae bacterium]|nr:CotH kinase family protein [Polyangiaceae bacterium]
MAQSKCAHSRNLLAFAILGLVGCSDDTEAGITEVARSNKPAPTAVDPSEPFYAAEHVAQVQIELSPDDWKALRLEGRSLIGEYTGTQNTYEYTEFEATAIVDGVRYERVAVRKKGYTGSLSVPRPSLKLRLDRHLEQSHLGLRQLTLNNNRQDPSNTHQCMAYHLFAKTGLPASRCNLAHVVVNGEDLGTYSNVEPITKRMLARHFADTSGNLYEGESADFARGSVEYLELKTNEKSMDRSDLDAVVAALEVSDDQLVGALSGVVDLDSFRTFWAMETLTGHWDSYSGNSNNYQVYHDPTSNRFFFLPWGTDGAFTGADPFDSVNRDVTVYASGRIANRLYALPEQRQLFRQRLGELNDALWDEATLLAEVDQIAGLAPGSSAVALEKQRSYVRTRGSELRAALAEPARDWVSSNAATAQSPCVGLSSVQGSFRTSWGDLQNLLQAGGEFSLNISLDAKVSQAAWFGKAGIEQYTGWESPAIQYATILPDARILVVVLSTSGSTFSAGTTPFHGFESWGVVAVVEGQVPRILGIIGDGGITFEQASCQLDAPVVGRFEGQLLQFDCLDVAPSVTGQ